MIPADRGVRAVGGPGGVTVRELARRVARVLAEAGVASPDADARWLVESATGHDPRHVSDHRVAAGDVSRLEAMADRRRRREPLQLIVGGTAFLDLWVECRAGVFVPRPETEVVARLAIDAARASGGSPTVVEPCTGAGVLACSLVAHVAGARVIATDTSEDAVALARHNLARVADSSAGRPPATGAHAEVLHGRLLEPVDDGLRGRVDVLVANPPYLPSAQRSSWSPEVSDHDPIDALVAGDDGHEIVDELLAVASEWLAPGGVVVVEIDERRAVDALASAQRAGLVDARVLDDLAGAPRVIVASRSQ